MTNYSVVVRRNIVNQDFGETILSIAPDGDNLGLVELTVPETEIVVTIPIDVIPEVLDALAKCAKEIRDAEAAEKQRQSKISE